MTNEFLQTIFNGMTQLFVAVGKKFANFYSGPCLLSKYLNARYNWFWRVVLGKEMWFAAPISSIWQRVFCVSVCLCMCSGCACVGKVSKCKMCVRYICVETFVLKHYVWAQGLFRKHAITYTWRCSTGSRCSIGFRWELDLDVLLSSFTVCW